MAVSTWAVVSLEIQPHSRAVIAIESSCRESFSDDDPKLVASIDVFESDLHQCGQRCQLIIGEEDRRTMN